MRERFANTPDLAHLAAIIAAYHYRSLMEDSLGESLGLFGGVPGLDGNAGYVGDVVGNPFAAPSLGNDDYMADLDSVNIFHRGGSLTAFNAYYAALQQGNTNRANEFVKNIGKGSYQNGVTILQQQYNDFLVGGLYTTYTEEERAIFALFMANVLSEHSQWEGKQNEKTTYLICNYPIMRNDRFLLSSTYTCQS